MRKVKQAMESIQAARNPNGKRENDIIIRSSAGMNSLVGDWVMVK